MGRSSPLVMAMVRKFWFTRGRAGRPKEIFDSPSTVFRPSSFLTRSKASSVWDAPSCSADTVRVRQSIYTSSRRMPRASARSRMRRAMSTRA